MINIVKGKNNTISFNVQSQEALGALSAIFTLGSITKSIPEMKTGATLILSSADIQNLELGKCFAVFEVKNADSSFKQTVREPFEVLSAGSDNKGMTTMYSVFCMARDTHGCHDLEKLPWEVKSGDKKYKVSIVDDDDGIDWTLERVIAD